LVFIRIILPLVVRVLEGNYWLAHHWYEYIITIMLMYFYMNIYGYNIKFISWGILDFRRKLFFMKILQSMISLDKDKHFVFSHYFPTINIVCYKNLSSWAQLRCSSLDLGLKYTYRIFVYCSVFMAFYLAYFVFVSLSFFGFLDYDLPLTLYITGGYDITIVLVIILVMLKLGSDINEYFDTFKGILIKYKGIFLDIKSRGTT